MPQTTLKTVPPAARIGLAGADTDFAPSDDDLLNSGEPELMRGPLRRWLARSDRANATYVYEAWLKGGGEPELVRESLLGWLADNAAAEKASFVYSAWLKTAGEPELVRDALGAWFELHDDDPGRAISTKVGCWPVASCRRSRGGSAIGWPLTRATMRVMRTTSIPCGWSVAASRRSSSARSSAGWPLMRGMRRWARSARPG